MSFLITGIDMPTRGNPITVLIYPDGTAEWEAQNKEGTAISVPPHGRLIDADALCKTLRSLAENEYLPEVFANWIENHIDTIIPADKTEDGE